ARSMEEVSCLSRKVLNDGFGLQPIQIGLYRPLLLLPVQRGPDGFLHFGEIGEALRLPRVDFRDMESEDGAEDIADLVLPQGEDYILELLHHLAWRYPAQVAPIARAVR